MSTAGPDAASPASYPPARSQILDLLGASGPYEASQTGVGPKSQGLSLHLLSADFNENGFIDEEDLQKIVLRLLNSDDVSEDLLMDVTHHVCIPKWKGGA